MIRETFQISKIVKPRSFYEVLAHLMQETGELAKEIEIQEGYIDRPKGEDGIIGEAVDVILCALDIIWLAEFGEPEEDTKRKIEAILKLKLEKWKVSQQLLQ